MKKGLLYVLIVLGSMAFLMQDALAKPGGKGDKLNGVSRLAHSGDIVGTFTGCTGSGMGIIVYIPGTSFVAFTDEEGKFTIFNVPAGTYDLYIESDGVFTANEGSVSNFHVLEKTENLVTIACPQL
jgi:hypothetical protein